MKKNLMDHYRALYQQAFVPIFVHDDFDTETLLEGCRLAKIRAIEYTLRRDDAQCVIPTLREKMPGVSVFVGSTIDCDRIVLQMKKKNPQLMTLSQLAPFVDGFVSMLPYSDETLEQYRDSHLLIPTAETSGEALRQMSHGATMIKVCGPNFPFHKNLHAAPTFGYCPTFVTGGITLERMDEAFEAGNVMTAGGFDLILRGEDPKTLTPERVAEKLNLFMDTAKKARIKHFPQLENLAQLSDEEFISTLPNYFSL